MGFRVYGERDFSLGIGFETLGIGFETLGIGFKTLGIGFERDVFFARVSNSKFSFWISGCIIGNLLIGVDVLEFRVLGLWSRIGGAGFSVQGSGFWGHIRKENQIKTFLVMKFTTRIL